MRNFVKRLWSGFPFFLKEISYLISKFTPFFIARPRSVYISFYDLVCDGLCIMCSAGIAKKKGIKRNASTEPISGEKFAQLIKQLKKLSGKGLLVSFTGGEPLLYKPLFEILELCRKEKIKFSFTTNGYLLNDCNIKKIIDSKLFNIGISIESLNPEINEKMRPVPNGTKKTLKGIDKLIIEREKSKSDLSINLKCVITQLNYSTIPDLVKKYGKIKGVFITPQPYNEFDVPEVAEKLWVKDTGKFREVINELILLKEQGYSINADLDTLKGFITYFESGLDEHGVYRRDLLKQSMKDKLIYNDCTIGYSTIFIYSDNGDLTYWLCPYMHSIGQFSEGKMLEEIWFSKKAMMVREKTRKCLRFCNLSCTRKQPLLDKILIYLRIK